MGEFVYRARDRAGHLQRGRLEAGDSRQAIAMLRAQGLLVLELGSDRDLGRAVARRRWRFFRKPTGEDHALFCRQMATMLEAGLPVVDALKVLARQTSNHRLRTALADAVESIEGGSTLAIALAKAHGVFPPVMVHLVAAGEAGGMLDQVLDRLAAQLEREEAVRQKVRSALAYPLVVSCLAFLLVAFMVVFVMPRFAKFFAEMGAPLPAATRALLSFSSFLAHWWWLILAGLAGAGIALRWFAHTPRGRILVERVLLRLPVAGPLMVKYNVARFARILAGLLGGGIPILKALAVAERVIAMRLVGQAVLDALDAVRNGESLVTPLARSRLFPPMLLEMVNVGEQSGTLDQMLLKAAEFYEEEVQRTASRLSSVLEPLLIFLLALVVGLLVVSLVSPIFDLWTLIE